MAQPRALDASRMHHSAKALMNQSRQFGGGHRRGVLTRFADESENLFCELVRLLGATFARHQTWQPVLFECRLRLVERRPRKTKSGCRVGDRFAVRLYAAKHLVLDLYQVSGIEKAAGREPFVGHLVGPGVESPLLPQGFEFGIFFRHSSWALSRHWL